MSSLPDNDGHYAVLWPRSPRQVKARLLARRLDTLAGKTIAQFWDYAFFGDRVFEYLEEELQKRFPGVRFIHWREFGSTHGADERKIIAELPQRMKDMGVDAAISCMGC
jgi:hypothetical protein